MSEIMQNWGALALVFSYTGSAIILGLIIHYLAFLVFENLARRTQTILDDSLVKHSAVLHG